MSDSSANKKPVFRVPRSRVFETHRANRPEILAKLEPVLFESTGAGVAVRHELEASFATMVGRRFATAVHSGTVGLFIALMALELQRGDEVITVANSDISTTTAILRSGGIPILCDVNPRDYTIDVAQVEQLITSRTRALLPVDLYGHPADVRRLRKLAKRYGLSIVEDAALAMGATDYGQPVGSFADATIFSFAPFKPLGSVGNGAMIVTDDEEYGRRLRQLTEYGHADSYEDVKAGHQSYVAEGFNVPLDPLQAALVQTKIQHVPMWTEQRQKLAGYYDENLRNSAVQTPQFREESSATFRCYTVRVPKRQQVYAALLDAGIEAVIHYAPPVYCHSGYSGPESRAPMPVTESLADEILCLPVSPELNVDDAKYVVDQLLNCLKHI